MGGQAPTFSHTSCDSVTCPGCVQAGCPGRLHPGMDNFVSQVAAVFRASLTSQPGVGATPPTGA